MSGFNIPAIIHVIFRLSFSLFVGLHRIHKWYVLCKCSAPNHVSLSNPTVLSHLEGDMSYEQASLFLFTSGETFFFVPPSFLKDTSRLFSSLQPPSISMLTYLPNLNRSLRAEKTLGKRELCRTVHFKNIL